MITLVLLELVSYACVSYLENKKSKVATKDYHLDIYESHTDDGTINSTKTAVTPIKKNYSTKWITDEFNVTVTTNSRGMREIYDVNNRDVDIAFFGDSFTFGHGVEQNERYSDVFASKTPNQKVANFAYLSGFQPEHYEFFIRNNTDLCPEHLIVGLYLGNDLESDINETIYDRENNLLQLTHRQLTSEGLMKNNAGMYIFPINILINHSSFIKLFVRVFNRIHLRNILFKNIIPNACNSKDLELGRVELNTNRALIALDNISKVIKERGGELTVLLIPQNFFFTKKNPHLSAQLADRIDEIVSTAKLYRNVMSELESLNIRYFDPLSILDDKSYIYADAHWNKRGHQIIGVSLAKYISALEQ